VQQQIETLNTLLLIFSLVLGSVVGSFLNVCVYRLPRNESVVRPRSRCPKCGNSIAWYDNIPVISWLVLGARCRYCREVISWQYPVVEAITGFLFAVVFWRFGITVATPVYMLLAAGLVLVTFVDLTDWTIPNEVTFPGIPLGITCSLVAMFYKESGFIVDDVLTSLAGVVLGGGVLYLLDKIALLVFKKRGMGFGDVKLLAMLGAFTGWQGVLVILMLSSVIGSIVGIALMVLESRKGVKKEAHYLPFGPYLATAGVVYLFFGQAMISAYTHFLRIPEAALLLLGR